MKFVARALCTSLSFFMAAIPCAFSQSGDLPAPMASNNAEAARLVNQCVQLLQQGKDKEMLETAQRAVDLAPDFAPAQAALGTALSKAGNNEEGKGHLERAVKADPSLKKAWLSLAASYTALGQLPEALQAYKTFLQKFPS